MDESSSRSLHLLIARASEKDGQARIVIEEMVMGLDRSGSADDVVQALQMLATLGTDELYQQILARLQDHDHRDRQQHPIIG